MKPTRVVHCLRDQYDVFIGPGSPWACPFTIGVDGDREAVIAQYRGWLLDNERLLSRARTLQGKALGCMCAPFACHGDVLAELADSEHAPRTPVV